MRLRRMGLACLVLLCVACGSGDPGGRTLASLEPVAGALPPGAHVTYAARYEPHWDSCDGRAGTYGWSLVDVARYFTSRRPPAEVLAHAGRVMARLGWRLTSRSVTQLAWRRASAEATLVPGPAGGWELDAEAPPRGRQASGC